MFISHNHNYRGFDTDLWCYLLLCKEPLGCYFSCRTSPRFSVCVYCCKTTWPFNHSTFAGTLLDDMFVDDWLFLWSYTPVSFLLFHTCLIQTLLWWHWWNPQAKKMSIQYIFFWNCKCCWSFLPSEEANKTSSWYAYLGLEYDMYWHLSGMIFWWFLDDFICFMKNVESRGVWTLDFLASSITLA